MDKNQKLKNYTDGMAARVAATPEERKQLPNAKELCRKLELSHTVADLAWYGDERNPQGVKPNSFPCPADLEEAGQAVAAFRAGQYEVPVHHDATLDGKPLSWGYIAVVMGISEHRVSSLFSATTQLAREGLRIGKGGAFLQKDPRFYSGVRKGFGVEDKAPKQIDDATRNKMRAEAIAPDTKVASVLPTTVNTLRGKAKRRAQRATTAKKASA